MQREEVQVTLRIPPRTVPADVQRGVYATQILELTTSTETILDFVMVAPTRYDVDESGRMAPDTVELLSEVVARVIMPPHLLAQFVRNYIQGHPNLFEAGPVDEQEGRGDSETRAAEQRGDLSGDI